MPNALLDTTLLSNFAHVRRPYLLQVALGEDAVTTPAVMEELRVGEQEGFIPSCDWRWLKAIMPTTAEKALAAKLMQQLDAGEAECLAVARTRGFVFLSDDLAARRLARQQDLAVSGTIGVFLTLVDAGSLTLEDADILLQQMIDHGYRSPVASLRELSSSQDS